MSGEQQTKLTHWKKLQNPDYIGAYALTPGEELKVTIASVGVEKVVGEGGKKEDCTVVHFAEPGVKPMILNATNCKTITALTGTPYIEQWRGRRIQIFATEVNAFGETVEALRIRPFEPKTELPELTPGHPKWAGAVKSFSDGSIGLEGIRKHFRLSDENARLLAEGAQNA